MGPADILIIAIIVAIVGVAAWYVYKSKKSGKKCIGCPDGCCPSQAQGGCNCSCGSERSDGCGCGGHDKA